MTNKDRLILLNFIPLSLGITLTILLLIFNGALPQIIPLFYSRSWGQQQLGSLYQLLILPALIVCITLINLIIYWQLHESQTLLKKSLLFTSLVSSLVLAISFFKIILIFV